MAPLQTPSTGSISDSREISASFSREARVEAWMQATNKLATSKAGPLRRTAVRKETSVCGIFKLDCFLIIFVWTLLGETQPQSRTWVSWASSPESDFSDSGPGVYAKTANQNYFVFTYLGQGSDHKSYIKAYSISGAILGSAERVGDECRGVAMLTSTRFVVAPKTTHAYLTYNAQVNGGTVTFSYDLNRTNDDTHSNNETMVVAAEPNTDYLYVGQNSQNILLMTGVYFSVSKYLTAGTSNSPSRFIDSIGGVFTLRNLELLGGSALFLAGSSIAFHNYYAVIDKSNMKEVISQNPSGLTFASKVEPLDTTVMYMSINENSLRRYRTLTADVLNSVGLPESHFNLARPLQLYFLVSLADSGSSVARLVDLNTFTITMNFGLSGYPSRYSLTLGEFIYGRNQTLGLVNQNSNNVNILFFVQDYCVVPFKATCAACTGGRYLTSNNSDYQCLLPAQFPIGYGNDTTYMQPCLGSLTSGCTSCPTIYTTCTACDNDNGYYFYPVLSICYTVPTMPDTLGVNNGASPPVVTSCSDTNCLRCASDYTQCTQCKPSWYLKSPSDGKCYQNNMEEWGISSPSPYGVLRQCNDTNCKWCLANYSNCTECKPQTYFTEVPGKPCNRNVLSGFGLKSTYTSTYTLASCYDSNCQSCFTDYTYCTACRSPYLLDADDLICKLTAVKKGSDGLGYLRNCTDDHCQLCSARNTECQVCVEDFFFLWNDTSKCLLNNMFKFGLTFDASSNLVIGPCQDPNCRSCFQNSSVCTECSLNYYQIVGQEAALRSCFTNNQTLKGLTKTRPSKLDKCTVVNCMDCRSWNQACDQCEPNYFVIEGSHPVLCEQNVVFERGLKVMPAGPSPVLSYCTISFCKDCFQNSSTCTVCHLGYVFNTTTKTCVLNNNPGQGLVLQPDGSVIQSACLDPFCIDCFKDIAACVQCDATKYHYLKDNKCVLEQPKATSLSYLTPVIFDKLNRKFSIEFSSPIKDIADLQSKVSYKLLKADTDEVIGAGLYSVMMSQETPTRITGQVFVSTSEPIETSVMQVSQRDQSVPLYGNGVNYIDPGEVIQVKGVGIVPMGPLTKDGMQAITQAAAVLSAITLGLGVKTTGGGQLTSMLKIIDSIEYVLYWNGLESVIGNKFIYFWSRDILAIFPNYLAEDEVNLQCIPQDQFWRNHISCSYLNNFGSQMITLAGLLAAFLIVEAITFLSKTLKKRDSNVANRASSILTILTWLPSKLFTPGLMIALLDGSQIEVLRLSVLSFYHFNTTPGMIGAAIVSGFTFALYSWFGYQLYRCIVPISHGSRGVVVSEHNLTSTGVMDTVISPRRMTEESELGHTSNQKHQDQSPTAFQSLVIREVYGHYRKPKPGESRLYLYIPLMFLGKSVLTQGWLVLSKDMGVLQIWIFAGLDISYFASLVLLKPYKSTMTTIWMLLASSMMAGISSTHVLMNYYGPSMTYLKRETVYGYTLVAMYSVCILVTIVPGAIENLDIVIDWIKTQRRVRPSRKIQSKLSEAITNEKSKNLSLVSQNQFLNSVSPKVRAHRLYVPTTGKKSINLILTGKGEPRLPAINLKSSNPTKRSAQNKLIIEQIGKSVDSPSKKLLKAKNKIGIMQKLSEMRKDRTVRSNDKLSDPQIPVVLGNLSSTKLSTGDFHSLGIKQNPRKLLTNRLASSKQGGSTGEIISLQGFEKQSKFSSISIGDLPTRASVSPRAR